MGTAEWSARQYLKFEDERTRPARDLLAQVPLTDVRRAVDLGCGPGNSTELLIERYPTAVVSGLDSSPDMLRQARERLPNHAFVEDDLATWTPDEPVDLLFANAAYQWVPDHLKAMCRVLEALGTGSVLAVQMPDNTREPSHLAMEEVARRLGVPEKRTANALCALEKAEPTANALGALGEAASTANALCPLGKAARLDLPPVGAYYDALRPLCSRLDIWHTIYNHPMADTAAIAEWFRGSALRPFLARLDAHHAQEFVSAYIDEIAPHYPARAGGQVLLRFPRLFIVAVR